MAWGDMPGAPPDEGTAALGWNKRDGSWKHLHSEDYSTAATWESALDSAPLRHVRALGAVANGLRELKYSIYGGGLWEAEPASALASGLTAILRHTLGQSEILFLAVVFVEALAPEPRQAIAEKALGIAPWEDAP